MKIREIQVGDDLSGKTLFINIPDTLGWFLDSSLPSYESSGSGTDILTTDNGGVITYSRGAGVSSAAWEDLSIESSDFRKTLYSEWAWMVDINLHKIILPDDFGIVTNLIDTSIFRYIKIGILEPISNMYIGEQSVKWIYKGSHLISNVIAGSRYTKTATFGINTVGTFYFEPGQTWEQWVNQKKYWDADLKFAVEEWGEISFELNGSYASIRDVVPSDSIIEDYTYRIGLACLNKNTLIKTITGLKPISSLSIGEELDNNNKITKIITHIRDGYFRFIFEDNSIIEASSDHRFILNDQIILAKDLKEGDFNIVNIEYIKDKQELYEIKTTTNKYELFNGIICECEEI